MLFRSSIDPRSFKICAAVVGFSMTVKKSAQALAANTDWLVKDEPNRKVARKILEMDRLIKPVFVFLCTIIRTPDST